MRSAADELSNEASFWVLAALLESDKHGYAILRDVELLSAAEGTGVVLKIPTLYGALERLTRLGLIEVTGEEVVGGRARRYHRLTPEGLAALDEATRRLETRVRVARAVIPATAVDHSVGGGQR